MKTYFAVQIRGGEEDSGEVEEATVVAAQVVDKEGSVVEILLKYRKDCVWLKFDREALLRAIGAFN